VLELTEHDRIDDYPRVRQAVDALGPDVRLSVDDAGSGYACLTHVLALRPAYMKLDRGWVQGIEADPVRQALVAGLQHFAQRTGCRLIAEGIETTAQFETLRGLGVGYGQGFLLGAPQPAPGDRLAEPAAR
jgi:EAL domain-containing protein (putative c-di-GMP-specific phosphodiesterase class I)